MGVLQYMCAAAVCLIFVFCIVLCCAVQCCELFCRIYYQLETRIVQSYCLDTKSCDSFDFNQVKKKNHGQGISILCLTISLASLQELEQGYSV